MTEATRTRLKVAIYGSLVICLLEMFPLHFIFLDPHNVGAWTAFGLIITTVGGLLGYYINKETDRPSKFSYNIEFEDDSDPENIPL